MAAQEIWTTIIPFSPSFNINSGYYRLNDVNDSSGVGNTLTNNNSVSFTTGKFGNCADFGSTPGNTKSLTPASNFYTAGDYTASLWINITTAPATNTENQFLQAGYGDGAGIRLSYGDSGGTKRIHAHVSGGDFYYNTTLTPGTWYNIVVTGRTALYYENWLYLDGTQVGYGTANNTGDVGGTIIGGGIAGLIDDVVFFGGQIGATNIGYIANGGFTDAIPNILAHYKASGTFTVPTDINGVKIYAIGKGGNGGTRTTNGSAGGGGGGARAIVNSLSVSASDIYTITNAGGDVSVVKDAVTYCLAKAGGSVATNSGTGAAGGASADCVGDTKYSGGAGANAGTYAGGGGGAATDTANGGDASTTTGGSSGDTYGGAGGNGQTGNAGGPGGYYYGGGGGGARRTTAVTRAGGSGGIGYVLILEAAAPANTSNFFAFI